MDKPIRTAVRAILTNENDEILVGRRNSDSGKNLFALIGGKPEKDEDLETSLRRELLEETNLKIKNIHQFKTSEDEFPDAIWHIYYYTCSAENLDEMKSNEENTELRFIKSSEINDYEFAFGHDKILKDYFDKKHTLTS